MKIQLKLDLKMKLTMYLFLFSLFQIHANTYSQKAKVTLELNDVTIEEVLTEIEEQTEFKVLYNHNDYDYTKLVTVKVENRLVTKVLDEIFTNTKIQYKTVNKQIILLKKAKINASKVNKEQLKIITGTITDSTGEPLPGASVIEKGTSNGAVTDFDGNFTMKRNSENLILVISYVGYKTQEIPVLADQTTITIQLEEDTASLDEVVLVGYGSQVRSKITGSIATVKSDDLVQTPTANVTQSLAGRLPGVVVTQNNGQPGGDTAGVSIRGFGNALVIVDGVPRDDYQQLDPNEIESISILKDASAAVYGVLAANGVILVTTKRGKIGEPKINYNGSYTISQPTFLPKIASPASHARYVQQAQILEGVATEDLLFSDEDIAKYEVGAEDGFKGTDWQDVVLKDWATMKQHNLNVQGGTERVKYFASVGNLRQNSLLKSGDGQFERTNIGTTVDVKINDDLNIGVNLKYKEEDTERPSGLSGDNDSYMRIFRFLASSDPTIQRNPNPDLVTASHPLGQSAVAYSTRAITGINDTKRKQFNGIFNFEYKIPRVEGLKLNGKLSHETGNVVNYTTRRPFTTYDHDFETGVTTPGFTSTVDMISTRTINYTETTTQIGLDYKRTFGEHNVAGAVILENRYNDWGDINVERNTLLSSDVPYLFGALDNTDSFDRVTSTGRKGVIGRFNYDYKGKYLVEALFRADASIQFPTDTRWGYFPGVSLGWVASKEAFLEDSNTIDYLKFRGSYARLGDDRIVGGNFDYLTGYNLQSNRASRYIFGDNQYNTTLRTIGLANPNITWATTDSYNFGVDANLWNSKLGIEFDAFYRKRSGLLRRRLNQLPDTFGANLPAENLGIDDQRGFELVLTHKNNIGDFNYSISGNVTWTRGKFIDNVEREFDPENPDDARVNQRNGQWRNRFFGYKTDGFYDTQEEIDNDGIDYNPEIGDPVLGDVKYIDTNGDGVIDRNDQQVIGRGVSPELFFGLNFNADYKGFDFSMLWQGAGRFDVQMSDLEVAANTGIGFIPFQYQADNAWNADNPSAAKLPAPNTSGLNTHNNQNLDIYQKKGDYLRLKTISLGYTIPKGITEKIKVDRARVYVSAYNLLTLTSDSIFDLDPEARGNDGLATYPVQKNVSVGVNISL